MRNRNWRNTGEPGTDGTWNWERLQARWAADAEEELIRRVITELYRRARKEEARRITSTIH